MRRSEREITDPAEIEQILRAAPVVYLGLVDAGRAYVVPMDFGYDPAGRCLIVHCAVEGRRVEILLRDPRVTFTIAADHAVLPAASACKWSSRYRSVMGEGRARFIEPPAEKRAALDVLLGKFAPGPFDYDDAALARTRVIRIDIESMTGKKSGY